MAVSVDGRRLVTYVPARVIGGRVYAPLSLVRMLVDRLWLENGTLLVERAGRRARVPLRLRLAGGREIFGVPLGELLRALGDTACYRAGVRTLEVRTSQPVPLVSASPFGGAIPPPREVFTPEPVATPRPVWSGTPLPRRTPLPFPP